MTGKRLLLNPDVRKTTPLSLTPINEGLNPLEFHDGKFLDTGSSQA
jgi:hypothetical protein